MASFASLKSAIFDREERKQQYQDHIRGLNAYERHKKFVKDYVSYYGREGSSHVKLPVKTDQDTLREGYRFIRSEEDDMDTSWEQRLVKRYYDKLFKEYCIADMSHYKSGKIGLRWRTEKEVVSGKGQFICGSKHCDLKDGLASYEVNFSYYEAGENKQALVKLVTCERCSEKLHYKRRKEKEHMEKEKNEDKRRKRNRSRDSDDTDDEGSKERRKGKKASLSTSEQRVNDEDDDENFDEYLEGMFP
ncbi:putative folate-sensitive fragile site protein Fra10Ac1 [Rosa chinensis]|uniref:Putative folate-sensitive fragile site protein Fra10Ac1 n=1 Tax=Rosa chinensis TaxID=74649 RepID=A0A2P6S7J2_ROSCH|nr:protein FRA10AC1 [Rosa chinensis]PRQ54657.1 putative folate-sensitive fragile site protein Fra10Ac1 [Rosa chinensis]